MFQHTFPLTDSARFYCVCIVLACVPITIFTWFFPSKEHFLAFWRRTMQRPRRATRAPLVSGQMLADASLLATQPSEPATAWCAPCKSYHAAPKDAAHHAALQCKATYAPPGVEGATGQQIGAVSGQADVYFTGTGLFEAMNTGEKALKLSQPVVLFGGQQFPLQGFKVQHQPPREEQTCHDPFCWNPNDPNCITPTKVQVLQNHMRGLVARAHAQKN